MAFASLLVAPLPPPPPAARAGWRLARPAPRRLVLAASSRGGGPAPAPAPPTFDRLREQLLQLHAEADLTQSKANSARVRLVRLTEAAENLKKRAVVSVRMGRENEAVDLLVQKKKLTKALENIKERIELLDKLSAKISEVISVKQNMLIEHALHPGTTNVEDSNDDIRVFSGKIDDRVDETSDSNLAGQSERSELQMTDSFTSSKDPDPTNIMDDHSAYDDFVQHIDSQLNSLQCEIEHYTNFQLAKEVDTQQSINDKLHKLSTILKLINETRERIAMILDNTVSESGSDGLR
ncbi:hypothetical protein D1007_02369 [Hordeum vulgare]|uniref:uncharacterized protein LOC123444201 n=1 Tax=Hordeum vulgare subsp. vulgare TaxID=112509 RepID=UPI001B848978|nr:uncharacterized protein LOC123444201 [Hordeum vulgare subsp. vulgare]XP_044976773.1 uncharacterized protein LOC123444201 [Hordeum vulgare subsp. vulgare]XP_044976774.1 uncharacterized protein LOC123444201 [Hordeum vulgare subsp. vulgare]XP_044976775.1 uncharacterized protein LOC123444201 [Hordeum vulgare subsp. vulgare]KAE8819709.1 hypothetical protein D1007_02369 [Hordeum vulgare]